MLAIVEDFGVVAGHVPLGRPLPITKAIVLALLLLIILDHTSSLSVERELRAAYLLVLLLEKAVNLLVFMVLRHIVNVEDLLAEVVGAR